MPEKYHIITEPAAPRFNPVGKYTTVYFREDCAGSCRDCVLDKCVYNIHENNFKHVSTMSEPEYLYACNGCLRCIQECTRGAFSLAINPEYKALGDDYWQPDIISTTWAQAETGAIPVSGAGYRGPFVGKGFDSMWTDMSEIVRPTRDGIHGREYINTMVEFTRRPQRLRFNKDMTLDLELPPILEVPLPVVFQQPDFGILGENMITAMASAAHTLDTLMFIHLEYYQDDLLPYSNNLVPCLTADNFRGFAHLIRRSRMVELKYQPGIEQELPVLRAIRSGVAVSIGMPLTAEAPTRALHLAKSGVDTLHFYADGHGNEVNTDNPRFLKEMIRDIHLALVEHSLREQINLVFSGGIALAEHMAKAIICGADAVAIDYPLLIALECRLCTRCREGRSCPVKLEEMDVKWGKQRILNLMGAWRNQLLEVMGAMGIREARRLRGEIGRSMWFEDLEKEAFGRIFGQRTEEVNSK